DYDLVLPGIVLKYEFLKRRPFDFSHACFGTGKLSMYRKPNSFRRKEFTNDTFKLRLLNYSIRLNRDYHFFISLLIQSGKDANFLHFKVMLNRLLNWCDG